VSNRFDSRKSPVVSVSLVGFDRAHFPAETLREVRGASGADEQNAKRTGPDAKASRPPLSLRWTSRRETGAFGRSTSRQAAASFSPLSPSLPSTLFSPHSPSRASSCTLSRSPPHRSRSRRTGATSAPFRSTVFCVPIVRPNKSSCSFDPRHLRRPRRRGDAPRATTCRRTYSLITSTRVSFSAPHVRRDLSAL
jgi:hypothetical protein